MLTATILLLAAQFFGHAFGMEASKQPARSDIEYVFDEQVFNQKLVNCNKVAQILSNTDTSEKGKKLLAQCRSAYLYGFLGGDLQAPPPQLGTPLFLQALMVSNIPDKLKLLAGEDVLWFTKEARRAFSMTKLKHQERCNDIPLVSEPKHSSEFAECYLIDHRGFEFGKEMAKLFPQIIQISGDGNCFYRSFLFGLIHYFHKTVNGPSLAHRDRVMRIFADDNQLFQKEHYVIDVGLDLMKVCLQNAPLFPMEFWCILLNRHRASDAMVYALRALVALEAAKPDKRAFIKKEDFDRFVNRDIMSLGAWSGQREAMWLAEVFGVTLTINDLTASRRILSDQMNRPEQDTSDIEVLYNGTHYDLYYLTEEENQDSDIV